MYLSCNKSQLDTYNDPICAEVVCVQSAAFTHNSHQDVMKQSVSQHVIQYIYS